MTNRTFSLITTHTFLRRSRKFFKKNPDLKAKFAEIVRDLQQDPLQPHLKLHSLKGKLTGLHAISLTHSFRITLTIRITEHEIVLLDIGSHEEVYR